MFRRSLAVTVAMVLVLGVPAAAEAETVVIRASGPSAVNYPMGQILQDAAQINLLEGDSLSLLAAGNMLVLRGPYMGPANGARPIEERRSTWLEALKSMPRTRAAAARSPDTRRLASK